MAKVIGIHTLALKPGVKAANFEQFMRKEVFPALGEIVTIDKMIIHGFTLAGWADSEHMLLRSTQDDKDSNYLWMIEAGVPDEKVSTEEDRRKAGVEAESIAQEFFDSGRIHESAAVKLKPFATRTSFAVFVDVAHLRLGG